MAEQGVNGTSSGLDSLDFSAENVGEKLSAAGAWLVNGFRTMFYAVDPHEMALDDGDEAPAFLVKTGIPMFFVFIAMEFVAIRLHQWWRGDKPQLLAGYRANDALVSTILGSYQQTVLLIAKLAGLQIEVMTYTYVYNHFRFTTVNAKENVWTVWLAVLLLKDLGYYVMHRFLHTAHLGWTAHGVHHSGEDYNLATALRQGVLQPFFGFWVYMPIALCGFHPLVFNAHSQLNTLYQFWIHTDLVGRLGPLEYFFNTPAQHRLHHRPPGNTNYAGVLCIWDRMFDTFSVETERKNLYGLAKQPNTFDPIKLNTRHFSNMANIGRSNAKHNNWCYRLTAVRARHRFVCKPFNLCKRDAPLEVDKRANGPLREKWDGESPMSTLGTIYLSFVSTAGIITGAALLLLSKNVGTGDAIAAAVVSLVHFSACGRLADNKKNEAASAGVAALLLLPVLYWFLLYEPITKLLPLLRVPVGMAGLDDTSL